jgi:site-specific DNA-methyltransferase (adenine-specific)
MKKMWIDYSCFCGMYDINIYNGDCLEVMDLMVEDNYKFDLILCDLPYGTTACKWDEIIPFDKLWERYNKLITPKGAIVLFGTEPFSSHLRLSNLENWKYDWTWDKITARGHLVAKVRPMQQTEIISVFGSNKGSINYYPQMIDRPKDKIMTCWECDRTEIVGGGKQHKENIKPKVYDQWYPKTLLRYSAVNNSNNKLHQTEKPVELLKYLIETYTKKGDKVLDNCIGSGSTAVACVELERGCQGIELDSKHYEVAVRRLNEIICDKRDKEFGYGKYRNLFTI